MNTDRDNPHYGPSPTELAELQKTFTKVAHATNWKLPINAVIDADERELVGRAITFYTGSVARFAPSKISGKLRVRAIGYYKAVGA